MRRIRVSSALKNLSLPKPGWLPVVWGLMATSTTLRGLRFYKLAAVIGAPISLMRSVLANCVANLLAIISPGRVGEGGKVLFFDHKRDLAAIFTFEKLADVGWLLVMGTWGITLFRQYVGGLLIAIVLIAGGVILLFNFEHILNLALGRQVFHDQWLSKVASQMSLKGWSTLVGYTLLLWTLNIATQYLTALAMGFTIPLALLIRISALTNVIGILSAIPGGIGVSQFVFTTILAANTGISHDTAGLYALLMLAQTYAITLILGGAGSLLVRKM